MSRVLTSREAFRSEMAARGAVHADAALQGLARGYALDFIVENIVSLRHDALAGGRLRRLVRRPGGEQPLSRQALSALDTATLARIDLATLALAHDLLTGPASAAYPVLRAPVALQTLGHSTWRAAYVALMRDIPKAAAQRIVVELINLDEGTPAIRVGEATMLLTGGPRGVVAFTDPNLRALTVLRDNRLMGVTINADQLARLDSDRRVAIAHFAEAARRVAPTAAIRGPLNPDELAAARHAGITYLVERRAVSRPASDRPVAR